MRPYISLNAIKITKLYKVEGITVYHLYDN